MPNGSRDVPPTPSAALELKEERQLVKEGYDFLDEKRLLLASQLLRELSSYEKRLAEFIALHDEGREAVASAAIRHGLHGLQVYPAEPLEDAQVRTSSQSYLGVSVIQSELLLPLPERPPYAELPSPEAEICRRLFTEMLPLAAELAAMVGNLLRLLDEYRRTERRARALEDVLLPEIEETLHDILAHLEDTDLEEIIRTRLKYHQ
ncbi:MAG TPA: V-type ATP synthase subunit D [Gammaproteobacteria bacterium]|nr:V-type ATP synthase subunit D [Gammaproteobacteria bacterium]